MENILPQKVQPAVFDDRGVQLQRQEVVVEDSDRTAGVDIQENQRPPQETWSLPASCVSLIRGGGRVRGRDYRLHHQNNKRCQPQGGPGGRTGWTLGHLLCARERGSVCVMRLKDWTKNNSFLSHKVRCRYFTSVSSIWISLPVLCSHPFCPPPRPSVYFWELPARAHAPSQPSRLWELKTGRRRSSSTAPLGSLKYDTKKKFLTS